MRRNHLSKRYIDCAELSLHFQLLPAILYENHEFLNEDQKKKKKKRDLNTVKCAVPQKQISQEISETSLSKQLVFLISKLIFGEGGVGFLES